MNVPEKVRCSINRKWFVDQAGNPADKGEPVHSWCEAHERPMALMSAADELEHDKRFHQ